jgi:uncharacterized protein HemX
VAKRERAKAENDEYRYRASGSAALQPERQPVEPESPRRSGQGRRVISKKEAQMQRRLSRMEKRKPDPMALGGVIGLVAVALMAAFVISLQIQLNEINTQLNASSTQLAQLEKEGDSLLTQYEQTFDMGSIESNMLAGGKMSRPTSSQSIYLELSEPDHAEVFQNDDGVFQIIQNKLEELVEYFQ